MEEDVTREGLYRGKDDVLVPPCKQILDVLLSGCRTGRNLEVVNNRVVQAFVAKAVVVDVPCSSIREREVKLRTNDLVNSAYNTNVILTMTAA